MWVNTVSVKVKAVLYEFGFVIKVSSFLGITKKLLAVCFHVSELSKMFKISLARLLLRP